MEREDGKRGISFLSSLNKFQNDDNSAGERARWLGTLAVLRTFPSIYMVSHNRLDSRSRGIDLLL